MEDCYHTLSAIYEIVKSDTAPHTYLCTPHEIILRHSQDWKEIERHLTVLTNEKLITVKQLDKIVISITHEGIVKAKSLKNNFVSSNFSFNTRDKEILIMKPES